MLPHRRQPTRLPRPWDSPGKNTGVGCHFLLQCIIVKSESEVAQLCLTLSDRDPMDCSLPGSSIHGIFQARVLEWGAIAFSESHFSHVQLCATLWAIVCQVPLSVRFFPSKNIGAGCHFLLQRIFLIQELNPSLLCSCRGMCVLYH